MSGYDLLLAGAVLWWALVGLELALPAHHGGAAMELRDALGAAMAAGYDLERGGTHLYQRKGTFTLLKFGPSDVRVDRTFTDREAALSAFLELAPPAGDA